MKQFLKNNSLAQFYHLLDPRIFKLGTTDILGDTVVGAALCTAGRTAASSASGREPTAALQLGPPKLFPDIAKYPLRDEITSV